MNSRIILDTGPLGEIAHPRAAKATAEWFIAMVKADFEVIVPEIADYELRRNLILEDLKESLRRLDQLKNEMTYLPITTPMMLQAARFWAEARRYHKPTGEKHELDVDAILAAQAKLVGAVVATDNVGHLDQFVETRRWRDIGFQRSRTR